MGCGCSSDCSCIVQGNGDTTVSGAGTIANPYIVTSNQTVFSATSANGGIVITPGGTAGHSPLFALTIDPASTAPISVSASGLRVDCCPLDDAVDTFVADDTLDDTTRTALIDTTAVAVTLILPATSVAGKRYDIKWWAGANAATLDPGVNTIDGSGAPVVFGSLYDVLRVVSVDGLDWAYV